MKSRWESQGALCNFAITVMDSDTSEKFLPNSVSHSCLSWLDKKKLKWQEAGIPQLKQGHGREETTERKTQNEEKEEKKQEGAVGWRGSLIPESALEENSHPDG